MFNKCKLTVIKRTVDSDLCKRYLKNPDKITLCEKVSEGQEFIIENPYDMPDGICSSAWADIRSYIICISSGGEFPFMKNSHSIIVSCTDLFRPVTFLIERII